MLLKNKMHNSETTDFESQTHSFHTPNPNDLPSNRTLNISDIETHSGLVHNVKQKSAISRVHECALQMRMNVEFEVCCIFVIVFINYQTLP